MVVGYHLNQLNIPFEELDVYAGRLISLLLSLLRKSYTSMFDNHASIGIVYTMCISC